MNDKDMNKLLRLERRQIEKELMADRKLRFFSSRRKLILIMVIVLCFSGVAFAYHQMSVYEWFMLESLGYDQILEQNPEYKLDASAKDQDITVTIEGLVADDLNTYIYCNVSDADGNPLRIKSHEGFRFSNAKELYTDLKEELIEKGLPEDYVEKNFDDFYNSGSSSLAPTETASNRDVLRFEPFDMHEGTAKILITQIQDSDGKVIEGEWAFDVSFTKAPTETMALDESSIINLPYKSMQLSVEFIEMEMGITTTRITYKDDHDDQNVYVAYEGFAINDQPLRNIFMSGSSWGDNEYATMDFFPVKVDKIKNISCEIGSIFVMEHVLECYDIKEFPAEIEYEGEKLKIEESFTDRYNYTITDLDYAKRDYEYLEFKVLFDRVSVITQQKFKEGYIILEDGVELPYQTMIDAMLYPDPVKRTKVYQLDTMDSHEELLEKEYLNYDGQSASEIRIVREHKTIPVHEGLTILHRHFWE
jgi:hypothetical protein